MREALRNDGCRPQSRGGEGWRHAPTGAGGEVGIGACRVDVAAFSSGGGVVRSEVALYARTCLRPTLEATLDAIAAHGIAAVQFNLECVPGLEPLPERLDAGVCAQIRGALASRGLRMAAVSGTYNMCHPRAAARAEGERRLRALISACPALGTDVVTLCSGTRDPDDMWRPHPGNRLEDAWSDLLGALSAVLPTAESTGVTLAVEPEVSNVVDSAAGARRLLDEVRSPRLRVCIDGANLFPAGTLSRMGEVLDGAFALIGADIVLAHAKDLDHDGEAGGLPAGHGRLDYGRYMRLLQGTGYRGSVVLHGLRDDEVGGCSAFVRAHIAEAEGGGAL